MQHDVGLLRHTNFSAGEVGHLCIQDQRFPRLDYIHFERQDHLFSVTEALNP